MNHHSLVSARSQSTQVSPFTRRRRKYSRLLLFGSLWLFGLFAMLIAPAPIPITPDRLHKFQTKYIQVEETERQRDAAYAAYLNAKAYTDSQKVWFWRFKPEKRAEVSKRKVLERGAWREYTDLRIKHRKATQAAKSELGLWSDQGVEEGRDLFWESFKSGKLFAQRQSLADSFFYLITERSSDALGRLISFLAIICMNFTSGMVSALFIFLAHLPGLIRSFQPGYLGGLFYFLVAAIGGTSIIATAILLMYGSFAAITMVVISPSVRRLEYARPARLPHERVD